MRILNGKYYEIEGVPGISGFQQWNKRVVRVVGANRARNNRLLVTREHTYTTGVSYRFDDGHLPECQPVVTWDKAKQFIDETGQSCFLREYEVAPFPQEVVQ